MPSLDISDQPIKLFLFRRDNGFYYVGYTVNGRKRWKSTGCKLKMEATKALTHFGELLKEKKRVRTLSEFIADFLPYAEATYSK